MMMAIRLLKMKEKGAGSEGRRERCHLRSELDFFFFGGFSKLVFVVVCGGGSRQRHSISAALPPKGRHVFDGQKVEGKGTTETGENAVDRREVGEEETQRGNVSLTPIGLPSVSASERHGIAFDK